MGCPGFLEWHFNIPYTWCVIAMAVFTAIYVILGGYMATAINDFIQGIIMLFGIVAVIASVLNGQGGFMELSLRWHRSQVMSLQRWDSPEHLHRFSDRIR